MNSINKTTEKETTIVDFVPILLLSDQPKVESEEKQQQTLQEDEENKKDNNINEKNTTIIIQEQKYTASHDYPENKKMKERNFTRSLFAYNQFKPEWIVSSKFLSTKTLLVIRSFITIYMFCILLALAITDWTEWRDFFGFWNTFTHLGFFALFIHFLISTIMMIRHVRRSSRKERNTLTFSSSENTIHGLTPVQHKDGQHCSETPNIVAIDPNPSVIVVTADPDDHHDDKRISVESQDKQQLQELNTETPASKKRNILISLFWINYHMSMTMAVFINLVYWSIIYPKLRPPGSAYGWWTNVSEHGLQFGFCLFEILMGNVQMFWRYLICNTVLLVLYMLQSFVRFAILKNWPYEFLDWSKPFNTLMYFGSLIGFSLTFAVLYALHKWRDSMKSRKTFVSS